MADETQVEMVEVDLDVQRMYRPHGSNEHVTVGPGKGVKVPAWVVEEWKRPPEVKLPEPAPATIDTGAVLAAIDELKAEIAALRSDLAAQRQPATPPESVAPEQSEPEAATRGDKRRK